MEWISVEDRLPEYDSVVLVCFENLFNEQTFTTAVYVNQKVCLHSERRVPMWWVHISSGHELKTVTHWQPLPEPPKSI